MDLGEFRKTTKHLPNSTKMFICNSGYEWYGIEEMNSSAWRVHGEKLEFNFANTDADWPESSEIPERVVEDIARAWSGIDTSNMVAETAPLCLK